MENFQMSRRQECREDETYANIQHSVSTRGSKVTSAIVALLVVSALLAAAVIVVCRLAHANIMTEDGFQRLKDENDALKRNFTERNCEEKTCPTVKPTCPIMRHTCPIVKPTCPTETYLKCQAGWERLGGNCYYFSIIKSTWSESRAECQLKGADLVKIDSRDEQEFLSLKLRDRMTGSEDMFWIGLTDSEEEGRWMWVDGSRLSTGFWNKGEPDNSLVNNTDGQDCVRMGGGGVFKRWYDRSCKDPQKIVCEKPAET
ncbi:C-type lectin domain family 4 member E-like [Notolabrus celidotus]|uniref:C-type lectin domain family 4 member E-like n=1 Tax=Notolabrus celidotus TaxID=1203425 RepID=UPI001490826B|nr:C-type lectin domain family 4 member E-like [Notolabrus celidotus]